jgi:predicted enzyme related to lactoylglutathione lyase
MPAAHLALTDLTLATTDTPGMVAFYNAVFDAGLEPVAAYGTTLYRGRLAGLGLLLCPNEIAGVDAQQNRHQLRFHVARLDEVIARAQATGGSLKGEIGEDRGRRLAAVVDPDGNTMELVEAPG